MDYFNYKNNTLYTEDVSIEQICNEIETPFYCYSKETIIRHYNVFADSFAGFPNKKICYAVKANCNPSVLKILAELGSGADVVSMGEIKLALEAGIKPKNMVFSGVGKTYKEIEFAIKSGIFQFNIESEDEVFDIDEIAGKLGKTANIAIRVNPNVQADTHAKITTGTYENKFGINYDEVKDLCVKIDELENINLQGLSIHIGSQITKLDAFEKAFAKIVVLYKELQGEYNLTTLDFGGGLGIPYYDEDNTLCPTTYIPSEYAEIVKSALGDLDCMLILEPGRVIVGNAGILISKVIRIKKTAHKNFVILDAGMNDLARPSMYEAYHDIIAVTPKINEDGSSTQTVADIVGPVCETTDTFARERTIPNVEKGDLIAFRTTGAYGSSMSNTYNSRPLISEILVDKDNWEIIRSDS